MSGLGAGVETNRKTEILGSRLHRGIKSCSLGSRNLNLLGRTKWCNMAEMELARTLPASIRGMLGQIFGAQQTLFFRRNRDEVKRAARPLSGSSVNAADFHEDAAPSGVIHGAVINVVARHVGTDAEMVVVRRVHYPFVL